MSYSFTPPRTNTLCLSIGSVLFSVATLSAHATNLTPIDALGNANTVSINSTARPQPQVILAGVAPAQIHITDDRFDVIAIVRPGNAPIGQVSFQDSTGSMRLAMTPAGVLSNGDLVYKFTYNIQPGSFGTWVYSTAWGNGVGQFNIVAKDIYENYSHSYPNLIFGNYPSQVITPAAAEPVSYNSVKRYKPQVIMAGYSPARLGLADTQFDVIAIVRAGHQPISRVMLKQNQNGLFSAMMQPAGTLSNGDEVYKVTYTYAMGTFNTPGGSELTLSDLWGPDAAQFGIQVVDQGEQNSHKFPDIHFGVFPAIQ
jgi:hypothetical protein